MAMLRFMEDNMDDNMDDNIIVMYYKINKFFFFLNVFLVTILVFIIIVFTLSDDEGWMEQGGRRGDLILLESVAVLCRLSSFSCLNQDQAFCVSARLPGPYPAGCEGVVADRYAL